MWFIGFGITVLKLLNLILNLLSVILVLVQNSTSRLSTKYYAWKFIQIITKMNRYKHWEIYRMDIFMRNIDHNIFK